jgi:hypothetical protein
MSKGMSGVIRMIKKLFFSLLVILFCLNGGGCSEKKDEPIIPRTGTATPQSSPFDQKDQLPPSHPPLDQGTPVPASPHGDSVKKTEKKVIVPDVVKKSWSKVRLQFTDRQSNSSRDVIVRIGSETTIEGTPLKVKVFEFLPEFSMSGGEITSRSNDPLQPAVRVEIYEQGKLVYKGWLFARMPDIHAFEHPHYALILKEGIR